MKLYKSYRRIPKSNTSSNCFSVLPCKHYKSLQITKVLRIRCLHWLIIPPKVRLKKADFLYEMTNRLTTPPTHHGNAEKITPRNFDLLWFHRIHPTDPFQFLAFFGRLQVDGSLKNFNGICWNMFFYDFDFSVVQYHKTYNTIPPR